MWKSLKKWMIWLGGILLAPLLALGELGGWLRFSARSSLDGPRYDEEEDRDEATWVRLAKLPVRWIVGSLKLLGQIAAFPFQFFSVDPQLKRRLWLGAPALLAAALVACLGSWSWSSRTKIALRYSGAFDDAATNDEVARAERLAHRLIPSNPRLAEEPAFRFCKFLANHDQLERANAIMEVIAPDNAPGFAPAHEQRAVAFANLIARGANPNLLDKLLWHLNQSRGRSGEELELARAVYYRGIGNFDLWLSAVESAAKINPTHAFSAADISLLRKDSSRAAEALKFARQKFSQRLGDDPLDSVARLQLAQAQMRLEDYDAAEETVRSGLALLPDDANLQRAMQGIVLNQYQRMFDAKAPETELLAKLLEILERSEDPTIVFDRMLPLYSASKTAETRERIRQILQAQADANPSQGLLQFALSAIATLEEKHDEAIAYLERALAMNPDLHVAKNNLAWLVSVQDPPDLDRALQLAEEAVAALPQSPNYRDTLGNILILRGDVERAITELERALPVMPKPDQPKVHAKLAEAYGKLGNDELAAMHQKMSQGGR